MDPKYFEFNSLSPTGKDGHDRSGLVAEGQVYADQAGKHLTKEEMKTRGTFFISNSFRRYVMYNALLYYFKQYNN